MTTTEYELWQSIGRKLAISDATLALQAIGGRLSRARTTGRPPEVISRIEADLIAARERLNQAKATA